MNDVIEIQLEWRYSPKNYFEDPIVFKEFGFELSVSDGVALAKIEPFFYSERPELKQYLTELIESRFHAVQLLSHRDYTLSKPSKTELRKDGSKNVFLEVEPIGIKVSVSADVVILDKDGNIVADTKRERLKWEKWFSNSVRKHRKKDSTLDQILKSYQMAVKDPKNELVHLYEIRDALSKRFHNKQNALRNLGVSKHEWSILGRLANREPLEQGRHRGKAVGALRPANKEELETARKCAAKLIEKYLLFLENKSPTLLRQRNRN